jgi:hypothetical protein
MFCPRCGQQAAEEVRFCSRCGLPLDAAAAIVEAGDSPEELSTTEATAPLTPRQRGTRKGLMIAVGGALFFVIVALLLMVRDELFPFLIPASVVLTAGVVRILYALLLEEHKPNKKTLKRQADVAAGLERGTPRNRELPHARTVPVSLYTKPAADTNDMAASPLSVTESTTRLLDEDEAGDAHRVSPNKSR